MNDDHTQYQTAGGQYTAQKLSLEPTSPPAEVPGYRLQKFLGAGAFGQVWVGQDLNTGRGVAVKFYLHRSGVNWSLLSREVKHLVQLSADRHVVQVLEVGWDADPPYYVMELVGGGSLEDLLQVRQKLPTEEAVELFRKICVGLNHCHAKGVLHCDLKPANILLGEDNEPRLADFGQSRMSDDQTPALGTLFYMAPEQADLQSTPDASWDVYAAGAILYRLITGQPPHRNDSVVQQLDTAGSLPKRLERYRDALATSEPIDSHQQLAHLDRSLARIIARCLESDPERRYANVQQILQDLTRRDEAQAQRPLMLLGIVGPMLILLATCIYGARSIGQATGGTMAALQSEASDRNQLVAKYAARTLENEVERYYNLANSESDASLREALRAALADDEVSEALREIARLETPRATKESAPRTRLLDAQAKLELDAVLKDKLAKYKESPAGSRNLRLATMFLTDARGTIISIAFHNTVDRKDDSAGRNFCYRNYFHGKRQQLDPTRRLIGKVAPLAETRLSPPFRSTATGLWKVAVSTPIYLGEERTTPDAVFVVTINLGDFKLLQGEQGTNQVAVLVQARDGPERGTILQHPLMTKSRGLAEQRFQVETQVLDRLLSGDFAEQTYRDPLAEAEGGASYGGRWLAAMQEVPMPRSAEGHPNGDSHSTDLLVLVQYRLEKVMLPVTRMRNALLWEGAAAILSILLVTVTLWYFVRRVGGARNVWSTSSRADSQQPTRSTGTTETLPVS